MPESQLKLTIVNAIIVSHAVDKEPHHYTVKAYTLNPEGRVLMKIQSSLLQEATKDITHILCSPSEDALTVKVSGDLFPYSNQDLSQSYYYQSILVVKELTLMSGYIKIPNRIREMMDEEISFSKGNFFSDTNQSTPNNEFYNNEPNSNINATIPLFSGHKPQSANFKANFGNNDVFRKRAINTSEDDLPKKTKKLQEYERRSPWQ